MHFISHLLQVKDLIFFSRQVSLFLNPLSKSNSFSSSLLLLCLHHLYLFFLLSLFLFLPLYLCPSLPTLILRANFQFIIRLNYFKIIFHPINKFPEGLFLPITTKISKGETLESRPKVREIYSNDSKPFFLKPTVSFSRCN